MYKTISHNLTGLAQACPYPLYIVGGRVRDFIAGFSPEATDTDICAPASAEDFISRAHSCGFKVTAAYKNTGTVKLEKDGESYEFTCFRSDEYVRGEHVPSGIRCTDDINLDARRRDFKCNAVYYDIKARKICDPLGGVEDIKNGRISTVAAPSKVFGEDGLRLMRLARISAQTGFKPTAECLAAAGEHCRLVSDVSAERIAAELNLILHADEKYGIPYAHYAGLKILQETGVLREILPELALGENMPQRADFHKYDVLEHSLRAAMYADGSVRLAALLHDVGKPYCFLKNGNFHGHDEEGARIAAEILERLKAPKKTAAEIVRLVATHMYDLRGDAKTGKVRKFIIKNYDIFNKILLIKQADFSACTDDLAKAPAVIKFKNIYAGMVEEGVPFTLKELKVKGDALIALGFAPESVGATLEKLLYGCASGAVKNDSAALLDYAAKVFLPRG